jgi:hypothetical protein
VSKYVVSEEAIVIRKGECLIMLKEFSPELFKYSP